RAWLRGFWGARPPSEGCGHTVRGPGAPRACPFRRPRPASKTCPRLGPGRRRGRPRGAAMKKVGVLGCGLMGSGIVEVCIKSGHPTVVRETNEQFLERGLARLDDSMERAVKKGKMTDAERETARARLIPTTDMAALA